MKKIVIAATVGLFALGLNACTEEKKEAKAPAGQEEQAGTAGEKAGNAATEVKKDLENAANRMHDAATKEAAPAAAPAAAQPAANAPAATAAPAAAPAAAAPEAPAAAQPQPQAATPAAANPAPAGTAQ